MSERARETVTYAVGYVSALVLTAAAFALVLWSKMQAWAIFATILVLGLVQVVVHLRFFLQLSLNRSSRHDLQLVLFSTLIICLMVSGTLVILFNLRQRMM